MILLKISHNSIRIYEYIHALILKTLNSMDKRILLIFVYLFCVIHIFSQNTLKFNPNLVLENSRSLVLPKPSSTTFSQIAYSVREEIKTSTEKDIYKIEFDVVPHEKGEKPFTNMVIGKSRHGDSWYFRIQHDEFQITSNADGSLHYMNVFTVDRPNGYGFGLSQRFIAETYDGSVGCQISNLSIVYSDDQNTGGNLIVTKNLGVNGKVGIGVSFPNSELDVNGTIRAKEVKIEATGWADFVFAEDYELPALSDIESHIKNYKHLPDMPSESDILQNGINIGEMQAKLLQKIEELTLYTIELEKEIKALKEKLVILDTE